MPYFDYAATTPMDERVLDAYAEAERSFFANANSSHALGQRSLEVLKKAEKAMLELLGMHDHELIFTSSAVESNNTIIKGLAQAYPEYHQIITSPFEHASLIASLGSLGEFFEFDFVNIQKDGSYDLAHLESLITEHTLVVSLVAVDSETGVRQPIEEVAQLCRRKGILFHTDATQAIGKCRMDFSQVDFLSFSAHKIYGPKGIAGLVKRNDLKLRPLLHGGHSLSKYRSSTPQNALIIAFWKALELAESEFNQRIEQVVKCRTYLENALVQFENIHLNKARVFVPAILNFSILNTDPDEMLKQFSDKGFYFSSKSACSGDERLSKSVYALCHHRGRAMSSYRLSLSHLTDLKDCEAFIRCLKEILHED